MSKIFGRSYSFTAFVLCVLFLLGIFVGSLWLKTKYGNTNDADTKTVESYIAYTAVLDDGKLCPKSYVDSYL